MNKANIKELMYLSVYGELTAEEQEQLDVYLKKHPEMKKELRSLHELRTFISANTSEKTSDELLHGARTQLRSALRKERNKQSFGAKVWNVVEEFFQPRFAFGGVGMALLGLLVGYWMFSPTTSEKGLLLRNATNTSASHMTRITNVQFIDADASDGEVEFEFEATAPMHMKGSIHDPEVQKILTHALLNESNDGVRLKTVNAIAQQTEEKKTTDPAIKQALITSLKNDKNPGVRREALRVLQQYEFDNEIRDAMLYVLAKDENSGLRVAAVNALEMARLDGKKFDEKTINMLKNQIEKEQNNYIRNRAEHLVKEIYQ